MLYFVKCDAQDGVWYADYDKALAYAKEYNRVNNAGLSDPAFAVCEIQRDSPGLARFGDLSGTTDEQLANIFNAFDFTTPN